MKRILVGLFVAFAGGAAHATPVPSPTIVYIPAETKSAMLDVRNDGPEVETYVLSVVDWKQTSRGEMIFKSTNEIAVDAERLTLGPHEVRTLRLTVLHNNLATADENTYRLIFTIMPAAASSKAPWRIGQIDMPILTGGPSQIDKPMITGAAINNGILHFSLTNPGGRTIRPGNMSARGVSYQGATIFSADQRGWYILPHSTLNYDISIADDICEKLSAVNLFIAPPTGPAHAAVKPEGHSCSAEQVKTGFVMPKPNFKPLAPAR